MSDMDETPKDDLIDSDSVPIKDTPAKPENLADTFKKKLPAAKKKSKIAGKRIWALLGAMGVLGGAYGFVQIFFPDPLNVQIACHALSPTMQENLFQQVIDGKISAKDARELACALAGQAFAESEQSQSFGTADASTPKGKFESSVQALAQSPDTIKRQGLVLAAHPSTRDDGLDMLMQVAKTADDWQQIAQLAYPWDTHRAIIAYDKLSQLKPDYTWGHIYLSRLYMRAGNSTAAARTAKIAFVTATNDRDKSVAMNERGNVAKAQNDLGAARGFYQDGLIIAKALAAKDISNAEYQRDLTVSYDRLGDVAQVQNDLGAARGFYQDGLKIRKALAAKDTSNAGYQRDLSVSYDRLGDVARAQNNLGAARGFYQDGLIIAKALAAKDTSNAGYQRDLTVSYGRLGDVAQAQNDLGAARGFYQNGLTIAKALAAKDTSNARYQRDLSVSYERLGDVARAQNDLGAAREFYQDGLKIRKALAAKDTSNAEYQRDLSVSYNKLGDVARAQNDLGAARGYYQDGLKIRKALAAKDTSNAGYQRDLSVSYNKLGDVARAQNNLGAARGFYQDGLKIRKALAAKDTSNAGYQRDLAASYYRLALLGGDDAQGHWNAAYTTLKGLDDAGRLLPSDKKWMDILRAKADVE